MPVVLALLIGLGIEIGNILCCMCYQPGLNGLKLIVFRRSQIHGVYLGPVLSSGRALQLDPIRSDIGLLQDAGTIKCRRRACEASTHRHGYEGCGNWERGRQRQP